MKISNRFIHSSCSLVFRVAPSTWVLLLILEVGLSDDIDHTEGAKNTSDEVVFDRPTVSKCCHLGYGFTFENKSTCVATESEFLPEFDDRPDYSNKAAALPLFARYEYYIGDPCIDGKYLLDSEAYTYDKYLVYSNGTLLYLEDLFSKEEFCMETLNDTVRVFICFGTSKSMNNEDFRFTLYAIGLLISVPFLIATALIYLSVEIFRDLRGKSLSCHVICLATGYFFLAFVQLASSKINEELCIAAGFIIQFFFVAAFFWLNIICFDTWRCIKNDFCCVYKSVNVGSEKLIFCYYFIYGFYGPIILSMISLIMDLEPAIPESYLKPNFGIQSCWFYSEDAALPYFYAPVGITVLINIIFFILSTKKIFTAYKKKAASIRNQRNEENNRQNQWISIKVYVKILQESVYLFCLMGINWAAEIISWAVGGSDAIWLVTDLFNTLQGIMIFYLFVLRPPRVRKHVMLNIQKFCGKMTCRSGYKGESDKTKDWQSRDNEADLTSESNKFIQTSFMI